MAHIYGLDEAGQNVAATAANIATSTLAPQAASVDSAARFPEEAVAALAAAGLLGLGVVPALGGQGQGPGSFAAVVEELARACGSTAIVYVMHVTAAQAIAASSTLTARDDLLRAMAAGRHLTTLALSERGSRSQFWAPVSRCERDDGGYCTSAAKSWVTSAAHADSYVASAQAPGATTPLETVLYLPPAKRDAFRRALFAMRWDDPAHRRVMELEGVKEWMPPREEGYRSLIAALDDEGGW